MGSMSPASPFGLSTIGQIGLNVADIGRAVAFYRDVLGLRLLLEAPNMGFFDCGGIRLMLALPEVQQEAFGSTLYFKVEDIEQAVRTLESRGLAFERQPHLVARMPDHELWMAFFRDPDRNPLAMMCEKR
jgi:catechol 2,3-dioxygenase-like lactoylglutathione lyase family enzyme